MKFTQIIACIVIGVLTFSTTCLFVIPKASAASSTKSAPEFPTTFEDFQAWLLAAVENDGVDEAWARIEAQGRMPLVFERTKAVFLYRGEAERVEWIATFSDDYPGQGKGKRVGETDIWMYIREFPADARLDYRLRINKSDEQITDPLNPYFQPDDMLPDGALTLKSEIRMPDYVYPQAAIARDDITPGTLSDNIRIESQHLGYELVYRVYTPIGYDALDAVPVLYLTDGQEFLHERMGRMKVILDNLMADGSIEPVIVVFLDARDPDTGIKRRMTELDANPAYVAFIVKELIPAIDAAYRTDPARRALAGISLGGLNTAYVGMKHSSEFAMLGLLSPFMRHKSYVIHSYDTTELPLKIFLSTGTFDLDMETPARLHDILRANEYDFVYIETHEDHSWGNWRALADDMLIYFFGKE